MDVYTQHIYSNLFQICTICGCLLEEHKKGRLKGNSSFIIDISVGLKQCSKQTFNL